MFLAVPRTPSSAFVFLLFVRVTFTFTAVTRVQIPSGTPNLFKNFKSADILFAGTAGLRSRRQRSSKIRITFAYTLFPLLRSLRASVRPNVAISDQPTLGDPITEVLLTKRHRGGKDGGEVLYANTG